jgi:ribonuclease BN (tRNA processing enzyme)
MKIEILGCSGAAAKGFNTTSILINREVLIDAGSAASVLDNERLSGIRHILLTHSHIDHIKELPFILDVACFGKSNGINIWGSRVTLNALKKHLFNGILWPKLRQLGFDKSSCRFITLPKDAFDLNGVSVRSLKAEHIEGARSFVISECDKHVIFSGDTAYVPRLFNLAASLSARLKMFFVEASFPDRMVEVARLTGHLTPSIIGRELHHFSKTKVIVYHIKPRYFDEITSNMPEGMGYVRGGEVFNI